MNDQRRRHRNEADDTCLANLTTRLGTKVYSDRLERREYKMAKR